MQQTRILIGEYVGIVVGVELRRVREVGEAIEAIDWEEFDER